MRRILISSLILSALSLVLLVGCGRQNEVFVANKVSWGCKRENVTAAYGKSSIIINGVDFLTYEDSFIFETREKAFQNYPGTAMFFIGDDEKLEAVVLTITISSNDVDSADTAYSLYELIRAYALDYYGQEADTVNDRLAEEGIHSMSWESEKGSTFIGYMEKANGSALADYTIMITCSAPQSSQT